MCCWAAQRWPRREIGAALSTGALRLEALGLSAAGHCSEVKVRSWHVAELPCARPTVKVKLHSLLVPCHTTGVPYERYTSPDTSWSVRFSHSLSLGDFRGGGGRGTEQGQVQCGSLR